VSNHDDVHALHDRHMVMTAVAVAAGALIAHRVPPALFVVATVAALVGVGARRPVLLLVGAAIVASALAANSWAGLRPPPPRVVHNDWVTLLSDPAPYPGGSVGADVRIGRQHAQAFARGGPADAMASHLAGEHLRVSGTLRPLTGVQRERQAPHHIATRLSIDDVSGARGANAVGASANAFRRLVARGATALPDELRPLFGGMVLGDDRGQSPELQDAFRAAGLTHLMVVSGENVAFALLVASPLIRRGGLRWRFGATLLVLVGFGVLTRWEPSVLRAEAMAAVAAAGALAGRPVPAVRLLAIAVTGCVLVDPLLVHSVGFQLSVAACAGLVLLMPALQRRGVPLLLAASIAAQTGAALVLVPVFGSVPLVSLPANVLAVPVAGPLMMWGLTAGPLAGLASPLAAVVHAPTHVMLGWEAAVARTAARLPLAPLGPLAAVVAVGAGVLLMRRKRVGLLMAAGVIAFAISGPTAATAIEIGPGATLWVMRGRSVLTVGGRVPATLAEALRLRHIHRLDVLVVTRPGTAAAEAAWPVVQAFRPRVVLAPEHHQLGGAHTARLGAVATVGSVSVRVTDAGPPLQIAVTNSVYRQPGDLAARRSIDRRHPSRPGDGHPQSHARFVLRPWPVLGLRRLSPVG
jgi:competence protein ComEC